MTYKDTVLLNWDRFLSLIDEEHKSPVSIDGFSLDLASIAAIAQYLPFDAALSKGVRQSAGDVAIRLEAGDTIYAVNTGVGASASTRTSAVIDLQQGIIKTLNCGILDNDTIETTPSTKKRGPLATSICSIRANETPETLPIAWTKAAMLVRINTLTRGNSGLRVELLQNLLRFLQADILPYIPLRGSISASGDLSPLSYLAGAIQGNPGIQVWTTRGDSRRLTSADRALKEVGITPICFAPKEVLALVNGTSVSAGAAALAMQDAHSCIILTQVLTAMAVEGLNGTEESFDPYLSAVRPHPGQIEAALNIRNFLRDSQLTRKVNTENVNGLRQDRYALRTASQWLGPEIENLILAHNQIITECNSVTDNPLVKDDGVIVQGGNFQASAVTSAMDRIRSTLHITGRLLFQQITELMNPATNNGLPSNLTADEPSCDFLLKGTDIASASYQSELAFLSHGMTPFMMVAEQGNQSLNSLALISTRYTHKALDIHMQLCANALVTVCQSLDLRATQYEFEKVFEPVFGTGLPFHTHDLLQDSAQAATVHARLWSKFKVELQQHMTLDLDDRIKTTMVILLASSISIAQESCDSALPALFYADLQQWSASTAVEAIKISKDVLAQHTMTKTLPLLGRASRRIYHFIRTDLDVPFLRNGEPGPQNIPTFRGTELGTTIGTFTSRIYNALRDGRLVVPVMECLREASSQ